MSLSGSILIMAIIVIRSIAINKLPKRAFFAFWYIAIARLLLPVSIPIPLGFFKLPGKSIPVSDNLEKIGKDFSDFAGRIITNSGAALPDISEQPQALPESSPTIPVLPLVWISGVLILAGYFLISYLCGRREFATSLPVQNDFIENWLSAHKLRRKLEIRTLTGISTPLTYGILRPVILMPKNTDWENTQQLQYMLFHEYVHIRRFDAVSKMVAAAVLCIHWFNPLVWAMYILFNRDIELACDECVVVYFGGSERKTYARTLIDMEEKRSGFTPFYNYFAKNAIEERIESIMKFNKKSILATAVILGAMAIGTISAFAATGTEKIDSGSDMPVDISYSVTDGTVSFGKVTIADRISTYIDPETGVTLYSFDGGDTFTQLPYDGLEPIKVQFDYVGDGTPEYWTYDEYAEWLEKEKADLQSILGEKSWTPSRGEFVWTQEVIDDAIAGYEKILEDIGNGAKYSKNGIIYSIYTAEAGVITATDESVTFGYMETLTDPDTTLVFDADNYTVNIANVDELESIGWAYVCDAEIFDADPFGGVIVRYSDGEEEEGFIVNTAEGSKTFLGALSTVTYKVGGGENGTYFQKGTEIELTVGCDIEDIPMTIRLIALDGKNTVVDDIRTEDGTMRKVKFTVPEDGDYIVTVTNESLSRTQSYSHVIAVD